MFVLCTRCSTVSSSLVLVDVRVSLSVFFLHSLSQETWPKLVSNRHTPLLTFLLVVCLSSKTLQSVPQQGWEISRKLVIARNVPLLLKFWFIVYVKETLKRFPGSSAVEGHIQSHIPIYTLLLLMEYTVKAVSGSSWELGKVVRLIRNKILLRHGSQDFAHNRKLCFVLQCKVMSHAYQDACRMNFISLHA